MNLNELNDAWIASGQKVSDLNAQMNTAVLDDNFDEKQFSDLKNQRDQEVSRRNALKEQVEQARAAEANKMATNKQKAVTPAQPEDTKSAFIKNIKGLLRNDPKIVNLVTSSLDEDGNRIGLTIPQDIQTAIHQLVRQYDSLEPYVNVEAVTTPTGSRVYEKWSDITPLADLDNEEAAIADNDDPKLTLIKYNIRRFAGINTATNSLIKDTAENILAWLSQWIAKKVVVTRNQEIIKQMNAVPTKPTIASFDDLIDMVNTSVDPAIKSTSLLMTNTSGFNVLSKVKNAMGDYLLQPDPKQPGVYQILGKRVVEIGDRWLPNAGTQSTPAFPIYFGDLKQAVTLFDRENMSLLTTDIGDGAFRNDQTKIRVIDRFDVEATDSEAFVAGSFSKIADQKANFAAGGSTSSN
ncbi:MAG: phage major capsid protein [Lactobacillus apis]|nr:phage major capsid protein [Lactobacillus apis]